MPSTASRPRFLNLLLIRMPVGAITSIAHRLSGLLLFLGIPMAAFLLDLSLQGSDGFERAAAILSSPVARIAVAVLAWSLAHHTLAGIRVLLIDIDLGVDKRVARTTAFAVNFLAPLVALLVLWRLW